MAKQCCSDTLVQTDRIVAAGVLLCGMLCQGQARQEPAAPAFRVQTDLVTVPFQVRRGSHSVSDLKPSDVVLLEDGIPRSFTVFEAPPVHLTLDIAVMFDVTNPKLDQKTARFGVWDTKALHELAGYWSEAITRRLLDEHGATIRFSIYRFDQSKLERLCQSTSDPKVLLDALHRLAGPLSAGQASGEDVDIPLPPGVSIRAAERKAQADHAAPQPWSLAGALSVLRDSVVAPALGPDKEMAARALVLFSTGAEGTAITPQQLADEAVAAGVPIYPVALFHFPWALPYDGYGYEGFVYPGQDGPEYGVDRRSMWGPAGPYMWIFGPAGWTPPRGAPPFAPYLNYPFEVLGDFTGGIHFEAVNHSQLTKPGEGGRPYLSDSTTSLMFSMTGGDSGTGEEARLGTLHVQLHGGICAVAIRFAA
jgi:hypothetical protein